MQTVQFKIDNNYLNFVETLLKSLTIGIKDLLITKDISKVYKEKTYDNIYFKSKANEYIYYLVELYGEVQKEKLNIKLVHYKSKEKAKKWRDNIIDIIHPNKSTHPDATKAYSVLDEIYREMLKNAK